MIYIKNLNSESEIAQNHFSYVIKKFFNVVTERVIRKRYLTDTAF